MKTRDIRALIKADEANAKDAIAKVFGKSVQFEDIAAAAQELFSSEVRDLHALGVFYEGEMIRCRDANAYFSGCLAGAAMIESYLVLFAILDRVDVEQTALFGKLSKPNKSYQDLVLRWTLRELIPITEELGWIRHTIQAGAISILVKLHEELAPVVRPSITAAEIAAGSTYIQTHADLALLHLMQSMRNLVHGGRCVRLKKKLDTQDFAEWAQLVMVLTVEIRDCLILKLKPLSQKYMIGMLNSSDGLKTVIRLLGAISAKTKVRSAGQGLNYE